MRGKGIHSPLFLAFLCISLAGCTGNRARGLDPIINGAAVQTASDNKAILLAALAADAGYGSPAAADWYSVAEAGFNYVDDQCRAYFDDLFFLERGREQIKTGLASAAQTTAAILAVTGAAHPTLAIVAQAFGFAVTATDLVAGTYLYRLPPATTQGFVQKLQLAFRDAASAGRANINSPTSAYYMIQRYLNLCLPPTIEAEIAKQVVSTSAFPVATPNGATFSIETISAPPAATRAEIRAFGRTAVISDPTVRMTPIPRRTPPTLSGDTRLSNAERLLTTSEIKAIQKLVCVATPDGRLGPAGSVTRTRIREFLGKSASATDILSPRDRVLLLDAVDGPPKC